MLHRIAPRYSIRSLDCNRSTFLNASPWSDVDIAFQWINFDFPILHVHEHWELFILIRGSITHEVNGTRYHLRQGQAVLIRPDDLHALYAASPEPIIALNFLISRAYMEQMMALCMPMIGDLYAPRYLLPFIPSETTLDHAIVHTQRIQVQPDMPLAVAQSLCKVLFGSFFSEFALQSFKSPQQYPEWLSEFLLLLESPDMSITSIKANLSGKTNYSYSRMIQLFKKYMGCTVIQYISKRRIEQAKQLLHDTDQKVIEIAASVGYDNISNFNRVFKRFTGQSPTDYRKSIRADENNV